jgi:hypothetical protein
VGTVHLRAPRHGEWNAAAIDVELANPERVPPAPLVCRVVQLFVEAGGAVPGEVYLHAATAHGFQVRGAVVIGGGGPTTELASASGVRSWNLKPVPPPLCSS